MASNIWVRTALTPKLIGLLVLCIAAAAVCIRLGYWQVERATSRGAERIQTEHMEKISSEPVELSSVMGMQQTMMADEYATPIYVTGTFRPDQLRVVDRYTNGQDADFVLAALDTADGVIPVVRGWVHVGADLPPVPSGQVTVYGYLTGPEDSLGGLTDTTTRSISAGELVNHWGGPILSGYVTEFAEGAPGEAWPLEDRPGVDEGYLPAPRPTEEGGFNVQNAAYAIEWIIFAVFFGFVWVKFLRAEVARKREDELLEEYGL